MLGEVRRGQRKKFQKFRKIILKIGGGVWRPASGTIQKYLTKAISKIMAAAILNFYTKRNNSAADWGTFM